MPTSSMTHPGALIIGSRFWPHASPIHLPEKSFTMTKKTTEPVGETTAPVGETTAPAGAPDPFDPAALRLGQDFAATVGVRKLLTKVPVGKPDKQEFVRVHPHPDRRLDTMILDLKQDREVYLVAPDLRAELFREIVPVTLYQTINRQGTISLWPCRLPGPDGKTNPWNQSALEAAERATKRWIRVASNKTLGVYEIFEAVGDLPKPDWPDLSFQDLLKIAFKDAYIDRTDHPVVKRLRGAV
jgi:hypothetical protein